MHSKNYLLLPILCCILSCGQRSAPEEAASSASAAIPAALSELEWLTGHWEHNGPDGLLQESWTRQNDSVFTGRGSFTRGTDTLFAEFLELRQQNGDLFYIPTTIGQNGEKPVLFRLTSSGGNVWVFENPQHDFPQRITYTRVGSDSLVAEISGSKGGQQRKETFAMKKVQ